MVQLTRGSVRVANATVPRAVLDHQLGIDTQRHLLLKAMRRQVG